MSVNPHPKYEGHWIIRFYPEGKKKGQKAKREYIVFQGTAAEAEAYHVELIRAARPDRGPVHASPTFDQFYVDFCAYYKNKTSPLTYADYLLNWKKMSLVFGHIRPNHLTPTLIEQYKTKRIADGVKPRTVNKELNYLAAMITYATAPEINLANPMSFSIKRFSKKMSAPPLPVVPPRCDFLSVLDQVGEAVRPLAALLYFGGLRYHEARDLEAEKILFDQGIMIIKGKGGKFRVVPIVPPLVPYLKAAVKKVPSGPLFINPKTDLPYRSIKKSLAAAGKRAGVPVHIHAHLLRHGFGTHSTIDGVGLRVLQDSMGHASSTTTEIYTKLAATALIDDFQKWGSKERGAKVPVEKGTKGDKKTKRVTKKNIVTP